MSLAALLARLGEDHRRSEAMVGDIVAALTQHQPKSPVRLSTGICRLIQAYVAGESRHLAIENGVLLAIARIRLTPKDLKAISRGMKARRGVIH